MNQIWELIQNHPLFLPIAMFIVNMAVSNMPDPDQTSGKGYKWLYGTLHGIIGGLGNVIFAAKGGVPATPSPQAAPSKSTTYSELGR